MKFDGAFFIKTFVLACKGIPTTLIITIASLLLSLLPAFFIAMVRIRHVKIWQTICRVYVSFMRGTPMVVQILLIYSLVPSLLNSINIHFGFAINVFALPPIFYAIIVFTLHSTALISELIRSSLLAIDTAQINSALSIGLTYKQAYIYVIIPQAFASSVMLFSNYACSLLKETSLAFIMTVQDITAIAKIQASYGFNYIEAYLDIFMIYIILCTIIQVFFHIIEWLVKQNRSH